MFQTHREADGINPKRRGTKASPYYKMTLAAGETRVFKFRLAASAERPAAPFGAPLSFRHPCCSLLLTLESGFPGDFDKIFQARVCENNVFWEKLIPQSLTADEKLVARQAAAGLLWTKQFYHYVVKDWLDGDPEMPTPPESRKHGRNGDWTHLFNRDVISMPDKWEYPWFATWDLAYVPSAVVDGGSSPCPYFFPQFSHVAFLVL